MSPGDFLSLLQLRYAKPGDVRRRPGFFTGPTAVNERQRDCRVRLLWRPAAHDSRPGRAAARFAGIRSSFLASHPPANARPARVRKQPTRDARVQLHHLAARHAGAEAAHGSGAADVDQLSQALAVRRAILASAQRSQAALHRAASALRRIAAEQLVEFRCRYNIAFRKVGPAGFRGNQRGSIGYTMA